MNAFEIGLICGALQKAAEAPKILQSLDAPNAGHSNTWWAQKAPREALTENALFQKRLNTQNTASRAQSRVDRTLSFGMPLAQFQPKADYTANALAQHAYNTGK